MPNGDLQPLGDSDAAESAARQAIEDDADDWRGYADLARALVARKRVGRLGRQSLVQEAVCAARRAVALAPDEPDAHLALGDAMFAVVPRRIRNVGAAHAEIDQAELLGADVRDLSSRRGESLRLGYLIPLWVIYWLFQSLGLNGDEGVIGRAVAWTAMVVLIIAMVAFRARARSQSFREMLDTLRKLSRKRLATDEQVLLRAPAGAALLAILVLPAAALSIPGAEDNATQSLPLSLLLLGVVVLAVPAVWIGVDGWLRPGTVLKVLRRDAFSALSVPITLILASASPVLVLLNFHSEGIWFALFLTQMVWMIGILISGTNLTSRRKKAASY